MMRAITFLPEPTRGVTKRTAFGPQRKEMI